MTHTASTQVPPRGPDLWSRRDCSTWVSLGHPCSLRSPTTELSSLPDAGSSLACVPTTPHPKWRSGVILNPFFLVPQVARVTRSRSFNFLSIFLLHHLLSISSSQAQASSPLTWTTEALSLWFPGSRSLLWLPTWLHFPHRGWTIPPRSTWGLMQLP